MRPLVGKTLFEIRPVDPLTYAAVSAVLPAAAAAASYVAAHRASHNMDPVAPRVE